MDKASNRSQTNGHSLSSYLSPAGAWSFALGTSIGWGSLVITSQTYLANAGPAGSIVGIVLGMGVMFIIATCYRFLMVRHEGAGGIYAYARDTFGYDHGTLIAWFMLLIYAAMLWANATSIQLFARYFVGDLFQVGFHYTIFGYDVYLGEALLSIIAIAVVGGACALFKRGVSKAMVAMCAIIVLGVTVCFATSMAQRDRVAFSFAPLYAPGSNPLAQTLRIATISSWAFIGFESITICTPEFSFERKRTFRVLTVALVSATALYAFLMLLSVSAYPVQYGSWMSYIADLENQSGVAAIPAFYAAKFYMGDAGTVVLMLVLLCLVITSLVGNIVALSRLMYALAQDGVLPESFSETNADDIPFRSVLAVVCLSSLVPFIGRTAIGWIVDVTTIGATLVYGFVAVCAIRDGHQGNNQFEVACGVAGLVLMAAFSANLMLPAVFGSADMATESYLIFTVWSVLGFIVFRLLLQRDERRVFGRSIFAWVTLLTLILCMSAAWMGKIAIAATGDALDKIVAYETGPYAASTTAEQELFLGQIMSGINGAIGKGAVLIAALCLFSFSIMLSNFSVVRKREEESNRRASAAHNIANTDPLTGVKSKHAYVTKEAELNALLQDGTLTELGIVVCDVNGLKQVNDTQGHKAGDEYIRSACRLICRLFKHSPVYRIGGDEFVVLLQGTDFGNRTHIMSELNREVEENRDQGKVVIAAGMALLMPDTDREVHAPFERADALMYQRKIQLKRPGEEIR